MINLEANLSEQILKIYDQRTLIKQYFISSGLNGVGEEQDSGKTPRGWHIIRAKIGKGSPVNTVFIGRRPTGEVYHPLLREKFPNRDWILTRILWLSGLEVGRNRLGSVDTMRRYIYIHGTPDDVQLGQPGSNGCIRMRNREIIELFNLVRAGTKILINE